MLRNDAPINWNIGFQDSGSLISEAIIGLHNKIMGYSVLILTVVVYLTIRVIKRYKDNKIVEAYSNHSASLEIWWTIIPTIIIILILGPSLVLLYMIDEVVDPVLTVKFIGHQWYWTVEYVDREEIKEISVYMIKEEDLEIGQMRYLEVDTRVILPIDTEIRCIVSSGDVIHSLGIPSLTIKMDAIPGRLNQTPLLLTRSGIFYGGCYELCGVMHAQMPICIEGVKIPEYLLYINSDI